MNKYLFNFTIGILSLMIVLLVWAATLIALDISENTVEGLSIASFLLLLIVGFVNVASRNSK